MGFVKTIQPELVEEGIWPTLMVFAPTLDRYAAPPLRRTSAQATANPPVEFPEDPPVTVPKVSEPSAQWQIQPNTNERHALPVRALGFRPHRVFNFEAFSRKPQLAAKVIAQKVKALMVHSRRSPVADHACAGGKQVQRRIHLVNQRMPSSSSHSLFECCQHALRPNARVRPASYRGRLSGGCSRERHCHRCIVSSLGFRHHASIFLHPFAPPALPGFVATMGALTPGRSALRILIRDNEHRPLPSRSPCFMCRAFPPFRLQPPVAVLRAWFGFASEAYRAICRPHPFLGTRASFGLHPWGAGSPRQPAESSSSSYGPAVHLQLLSTPSHEDAVTFSYKVQT